MLQAVLSTVRKARSLGLTVLIPGMLAGCQSPETRPLQPKQFEIATSSMAPRLMGKTLTATCSHCGRRAWVASDSFNPDFPIRCYRCGGLASVPDPPPINPGQKVTLHPLSASESLDRFQIVVSKKAGGPQVKRILGLPGESLTFLNGELLIDGQPYRKSLAELRRIAVPLSALQELADRQWTVQSTNAPFPTAAQPDADSVTPGLPLKLAANSTLRWRYFKPARVHPTESPRDQWLTPARVDDDYECNQGAVYALHEVPDLLVDVIFEAAIDSPTVFHSSYLGQPFKLSIIPPELALDQPGPSPRGIEPIVIAAREHVSIALCDGRLLVESDCAQKVWNWPTESPDLEASRDLDSQTGFDLAATAPLVLRNIIVARDLYLRPAEWSALASWRLGEDEYFLIGDNLPMSEDSRESASGGVPRSQIMGIIEP